MKYVWQKIGKINNKFSLDTWKFEGSKLQLFQLEGQFATQSQKNERVLGQLDLSRWHVEFFILEWQRVVQHDRAGWQGQNKLHRKIYSDI